MLSAVAKLAGNMKNLLIGGKTVIDYDGIELVRNSLSGNIRAFPEHHMSFTFDKFGKAHVVLRDVDHSLGKRAGLPKWLGTLISTLTEAEARSLNGGLKPQLYSQADALELLMRGGAWEDPVSGEHLSMTQGLPCLPLRASVTDCALRISYVDIAEARSRSCLLMALTYDPKLKRGASLVPPHLSSVSRKMPPSPSPSSARSGGGEMAMHQWSTVESANLEEELPSYASSPMSTRPTSSAAPNRYVPALGRPSSSDQASPDRHRPPSSQATSRLSSPLRSSRHVYLESTLDRTPILPPLAKIPHSSNALPRRPSSSSQYLHGQQQYLAHQRRPQSNQDQRHRSPRDYPVRDLTLGSSHCAAGDSLLLPSIWKGGAEPAFGSPVKLEPVAEHQRSSSSQRRNTSRQSARSSQGKKDKKGLEEVYAANEDENANIGPWAASAEEEEFERAQASRPGTGTSVQPQNVKLNVELLIERPEAETEGEVDEPGQDAFSMALITSSLIGLELGSSHSPRSATTLSLKSKFALSSPALVNDKTPLFLLPQPRSKSKASLAASSSATRILVEVTTPKRGRTPAGAPSLPLTELIVAPQPLVDPVTELPPNLAAANLGILSRHQSKVDEAVVHALRDKLEHERRATASIQLEHEHKVIEAFGVTGSICPSSPSPSASPQLETQDSKRVPGSSQGTGHKLAPGYEPMTTSEMAIVVERMKAAYQAAAAEKVSYVSKVHRDVIGDNRLEKEHALRQVVSNAAIQAEIAAAKCAANREEVKKANRARVEQMTQRAARLQRRARDRQFAHAFVRQANLLSKSVASSERGILAATQRAEAIERATFVRESMALTRENIVLASEDLQLLNQWKAGDVRKGGYTVEMQDYKEAVDAHNHDVVELRRLEEKESNMRMGPAGGCWGSQPLERQPFPLPQIVSATDAKMMRQGATPLVTSCGSLATSKTSSARGLSPQHSHFAEGPLLEEGEEIPSDINLWEENTQGTVTNTIKAGTRAKGRPIGIVI